MILINSKSKTSLPILSLVQLAMTKTREKWWTSTLMKLSTINRCRSSLSKRVSTVMTLTTTHSTRQSRILHLAKPWRSLNALTKTKSTMLRVCVTTVIISTEETAMLTPALILTGLCMPKVNVKTATWMIITSKKDVWTKRNNNQKGLKRQSKYLIPFQSLSKIPFSLKDKKFRIVSNNDMMFEKTRLTSN